MARILFFGRLGDLAGQERELAIDSGVITVADLRDWLERSVPELAGALGPSVRFALDMTIATDDATIKDVAEIALLPPMSGG